MEYLFYPKSQSARLHLRAAGLTFIVQSSFTSVEPYLTTTFWPPTT